MGTGLQLWVKLNWYTLQGLLKFGLAAMPGACVGFYLLRARELAGARVAYSGSPLVRLPSSLSTSSVSRTLGNWHWSFTHCGFSLGRRLSPGAAVWSFGIEKRMSNNAFERTVVHCGPRLAAARRSWSAAQLGR